MMQWEAIVLIGHGGLPSDCPSELVTELKRVEAQRRASGRTEMTAREAELDREIREWPRTSTTDPYHAGLEAIASKLAPLVSPRRVVVAYNEFCAPSVEQAIDALLRDGARRITLATTMFTPGGSHAEREIPDIIERARRAHPEVEIRYAWPFDLDRTAAFLAEHIDRRRLPE